MQQPPQKMTRATLIGATERAKVRVQGILTLAADIQTDTRREQRLARHECKACFYTTRLGGSAMTERPCMACGEHQLYGSTATDVLCLACAKTHALCKHCGADIDLRVRRRDWPAPVSEADKRG